MNRAIAGASCLAVVVSTAPCIAQQVYRCTGQNGTTEFQQRPCDGGAAMRVQPGNTIQATPLPSRAAEDRRALGEGLTDQEVRQRYGVPETINTDIVNGVVSEQYVIRNSNGTTYVYMRNGRSYAVQFRPGDVSLRQQERCYTDREIWNASVSANSNAQSPETRQRLQDQVRDMERKRCR
jgi:hypothetical protein